MTYYAVTDCRTDLMALQAGSIGAFGCGATLCVVNNAAPGAVRAAITSEATRLGVRSVDVPAPRQDRETPNHAHASALMWLWPDVVLAAPPDIAILCDFDMFLVAPLDIAAFMDGAAIAGVPQERPIGAASPLARYFWPGFVAFDLRHLPDADTINLDCGIAGGTNVDVGGQLHYYLAAHPDVVTRGIACQARITRADGLLLLPPESRDGYEDAFRCDILAGGRVFHYTGGTGWDFPAPDLVARKTAWVVALVEGCIAGRLAMPLR